MERRKTMKEKKTELLCVGDFLDSKMISPNWTPFDYLLEVARVGQEKMMTMMHNKPVTSTTTISFNNNGKLLIKRKRPEEGESRKGYLIKRSKQDEMMMISPKAKAKAKAKAPPNRPLPPVAVPVQELHEDFKRYIVERMGGQDWVLVIEKTLFNADVGATDSRLSIPLLQIQTPHFLSQGEFEELRGKRPFEVRFLDPSLNEGLITINRWSYSGKCSSYVLIGTWNDVVAKNGLKIGDLVQLWSFRVGTDLCFALVRLPAA